MGHCATLSKHPKATAASGNAECNAIISCCNTQRIAGSCCHHLQSGRQCMWARNRLPTRYITSHIGQIIQLMQRSRGRAVIAIRRLLRAQAPGALARAGPCPEQNSAEKRTSFTSPQWLFRRAVAPLRQLQRSVNSSRNPGGPALFHKQRLRSRTRAQRCQRETLHAVTRHCNSINGRGLH